MGQSGGLLAIEVVLGCFESFIEGTEQFINCEKLYQVEGEINSYFTLI